MKNEKKLILRLALIVLRKDNTGQYEALLGKRKGFHGARTWGFPGGHLEYGLKRGDAFKKCALRELREETGREMKIYFIDNYPEAATNDIFKEENKHYLTLYMRAGYLSGKPRIMKPDKYEEWRWLNWQEEVLRLPSKELFLPIQNLIKQGYNPLEDLLGR